MSLYNTKIIKEANSLKYFNEILGLPMDLSQVLLDYFKNVIGGDKIKNSYYMGKIRKNIPDIIDNAESLIADPSVLEKMFPFQGEEKQQHPLHDKIKYIAAVNRKYIPWVTKLIDDGIIEEEDFIKVKNMLEQHAELVRHGTITGDEANINSFEDDSHLFRYLKKYKVDTQSLEELIQLPEVKMGSKFIDTKETEDFLIHVYHVFTFEAMQTLAGKDSAWCVAQDQSAFDDYDPPDYYMFFFNGEPEILVHSESDQIKAQDDSTNFDPLRIYAIKDLIDNLGLNTGNGDFKKYVEIISKFETYRTYDNVQMEQILNENPMNIIYVDPTLYGHYVGNFVKQLSKIQPDDIERMPRSFMQYLGQYLKINQMDTHFRYMENLITDYLHQFEYTSYFKKIPDIFHTTGVYEDGYLGTIKERLDDSFSLPYSVTIMDKLNPKEREREDISTTFIDGISKGYDTQSPTISDMSSLLTSYAEMEPEKLYGMQERVENALLSRMANAVMKAPELYRAIRGVDEEKIKTNRILFEATKHAIKTNPELYEFTPESIRHDLRFSLLRGYIELAKKVAAGEEPPIKLENAPHFIKNNPKYKKLVKNIQPNKLMDFSHRLQRIIGEKEVNDETGNWATDARAYSRVINLFEKAGITTEELLNPDNYPAIVEYLKRKGSQYIYLPKSLRANKEIIDAAAIGITESRFYDVRRLNYPALLQQVVEQKIKKKDESSKLYRNKDELSVDQATILYEEHSASSNIKFLYSLIQKYPDLANNVELLQRTYSNISEALKKTLTQYFYVGEDELEDANKLSFVYSVHGIELINDEFWDDISNIMSQRLLNSTNDKLQRDFRNILETCKKIGNVFNIRIIDENFMSVTYEKAIQCAFLILRHSENSQYASEELKELNSNYDNRIAFDDRVTSFAEQLASQALEKRNFSWFNRLSTMFPDLRDSAFLQNRQEVNNLYSGNWYSKIKTGSIGGNMNWYKILTSSTIDVGSEGYGELSNFAAYPFVFDGIQCGGMEGLLQSLKFADPEKQARICSLHGVKAKGKGKKGKWFLDQNLHWQGQTFSRHGPEYQQLLDRAFQALFDQSEAFREALRITGDSALTHSIGKSDPNRTVLTEDEFIQRLYALRDQLTLDAEENRGSEWKANAVDT